MRVAVVANSDSSLLWGINVAKAFNASVAQIFFIQNGHRISDRFVASLGLSQPITFAAVGDVAQSLDLSVDIVLASLPGRTEQRDLFSTVKALTGPPLVVTGFVGLALRPLSGPLMRRIGAADVVLAPSAHEAQVLRALLCDALKRPRVLEFGFPYPASEVRRKSAALERIVFAPQALFPRSVRERQQLLNTLEQRAVSLDVDLIVKLRGFPMDNQLHKELHPFTELDRSVAIFNRGSLAQYPVDSTLVVSLSSTILVEAYRRGFEIAALSDYGLQYGAWYFFGSGVTSQAQDLALRGRSVTEAWSELRGWNLIDKSVASVLCELSEMLK